MKEIIEVFTPIIVAIIPTIATLITSKSQKRENRMHFARTSLLTLMLEDRIRMSNNEAPINYKSILYEADDYFHNNGNSYMKEKLEEYKEIVKEYAEHNDLK